MRIITFHFLPRMTKKIDRWRHFAVIRQIKRCMLRRLKNDPPPPKKKDSHFLIPRTCEHFLKWQKMWLKDFERSLFWTIQLGPKYNHMYPLKKKAEELLRENRRNQWDYGDPELSSVATSQGMSPATRRSWKRQGMYSSLESLKE